VTLYLESKIEESDVGGDLHGGDCITPTTAEF